VKEVATIYGEYDLIAKVEIENLEKLDEFVFNMVRKIDVIVRTITLIVM
jgi:DNA-binding Lrp family transcriptional regulator